MVTCSHKIPHLSILAMRIDARDGLNLQGVYYEVEEATARLRLDPNTIVAVVAETISGTTVEENRLGNHQT